jgi:benzoate/toluate 1,2-dioxygenase beta subunit
MSAQLTETAVPGYFDLGYYEKLVEMVAAWRGLGEVPAEALPSAETYAACCRLLFAEARLLDNERLVEWLGLFTQDCVYWLPTDVEGRDPRTTVTWEMNDRRRLEERVERLSTGRAYSQAPPTRLTHLYTNIEVMMVPSDDGAETAHVLCQFLIQTNLVGRVTQRAGWNGYVLRRVGDAWRIVVKRINLYDADLPQDNNSFTL